MRPGTPPKLSATILPNSYFRASPAMTFRLLSACILLTLAGVAAAADWPQWRGPNRDGKSAETGLLKGFPEGGPKLLWSVTDPESIGTGYGTPAIVKGRLYIVGADGAKQDAAESCVCLDAATGKPVWKMALGTTKGKFLDGWGGGPRSTPTVDGDTVYVLGSTGDLVAFGAADGKVIWHKNLVKEYGGAIPQWGYSESPLIDGEKIVVSPGSKTGMVALDKKTGEKVWACEELKDAAGYSSVIPATFGGVKTYVQQTQQHAVGVEAATGKLLWSVGEIKRRIAVIPTPVVVGNDIYFTAGYGAGGELVTVAADGKSAKVASKTTAIANHHGGVIELNGKLYGHSDAKQWFCYDFKAGGDDLVWASDKLDKGSITYADGQFYCYGQGKGTLVTITASEGGWQETGRFTIPEKSALRPGQGLVWAHPVVADGKLFLRDYEKLFVYDIGAPKKGE